ncbi:MAG: glycosyltransferase family 39 protein [Caldilineaceae bacterium]|nr:glycosyltransferase family 39 protein [Caldilineaceae bacterium]
MPRLWRLLGGLVAVGLAVAAQRAINQRLAFDAGLLGAAALALWLWLYGAPRRPAHVWVDVAAPGWRRGWLGAAGLLMACGLAVWGWRRLDVGAVTTRDWQWYAAGVLAGVVAGAVMQPWGARPRLRPTGWAFWFLLIGVAAGLRLWRLGEIPLGTWYDEAANGLEALRVLREPAYRPIYTDGVNATGHYLWLIVGAFRLLGVGTVALRVISALMGVATVAAAYGLGKEVYGRAVGLAAAGLVATAHWSVTFSRMGMYNSATPLAELAVLWFLARAVRRNAPLDYGLAGLALGLGLCFYSAFQLFVVVLGLFVAWLLWCERAQWRRIAPGLGVMLVVAALVIAPVAKLALVKPEMYFARVQSTSLLRDRDVHRLLPALAENTRRHLLMFNGAGDPNGRHNLPGAPLLDTISGGLLILGLGLALRRANRLEMALLPVWAVVGLLGGILSLGFEAPQSLRSIAALPAVYFIVALPLGELAREWVTGPGRTVPALGAWIVLLFLLPIGLLNTRLYFARQTSDFASWNAYSTAETWTAEELRHLDGARAYVVSLYDRHPTVRFLAPGVSYARLETNATLPLLQPAVWNRDGLLGPSDQDIVLILDIERRELFEEARRLYPHAVFEERRPPFGGPVVIYVARLSAADQASVQGLVATYHRPGDAGPGIARDEPTLDSHWPEDAPLALPFRAEWQGVLAVDSYGPHQLVLQAPGEAALYLGEEPVLQGDASQGNGLSAAVMLPRGNHNLRVWAEGGEGRVVLAWRAPDGEAEVIPPWMLYRPPVRGNGLLGHYFGNGEWAGPESFAQIDPRIGMYFHVPVLPRPYTVVWTGKLAIPQEGVYGFALESVDESLLKIDGSEVAASRTRGEFSTGEAALSSGLHDIEVRYADRTDHTFVNLYWNRVGLLGPSHWRPPGQEGGGYQIIPSDFLFPPQKDYTRIEMPALPLPADAAEPVVAGMDRAAVQPAEVEVVMSGLNAPRGIAAGDGRIYVAESGAGRALMLDVTSGETVELRPGEQPFVEPMDMAVDGAGRVYVLDAATARIERFDAQGNYQATLGAPPELANRARGIGVDAQGRIWVASTPAQRVVALDMNGAVVAEVLRPAVSGTLQAMQPVDVAGMDDGSVYVTDAGNHRLIWFDWNRAGLLEPSHAASFILSSIALPMANSLDGPHLAVDNAGRVYVTQPEMGQVLRLNAQGGVDALWSLRTAATPDVKPVGIAVDGSGRLWVVDVQGGRVLRVTPGGP